MRFEERPDEAKFEDAYRALGELRIALRAIAYRQANYGRATLERVVESHLGAVEQLVKSDHYLERESRSANRESRIMTVGPAPACGHNHYCEDFDTEPDVHYPHGLPRCRDIAVGSLPVVGGGIKFLCQRHIEARLAVEQRSGD